MREISVSEIEDVSGGFAFLVQAIIIGVTAFAAPGLVGKRVNQYNGWGGGLSQNYWDNQYPYDPNSNSCYGPGC